MKYNLSNEQARKFILLKQGLMGHYKYVGKKGALDYIKEVGCIQYDPIDVCGKNAELVLQSRVKGFKKEMLYDLLYKDRKLMDYYDKVMSILSIDDWKYFKRVRDRYDETEENHPHLAEMKEEIIKKIKEKGHVCSKDFANDQKVEWNWNKTSIAKAAIELMYFHGELVVHHKKNTIKYYALAKDYIPKEDYEADDPFQTDLEFYKYRVLRRISAIGLLWNRPTEAYLFIHGLRAKERTEVYQSLLKEDKIVEIEIEGINELFYALKSDEQIILDIISGKTFDGRTELIAPLDGFIWDRRLTETIFDFRYKWEIYNKEEDRVYGYYVLPIISNTEFIGRIEVINQKKEKTLLVKNIWFEDHIKLTKTLKNNILNCLDRFMTFNDCHTIDLQTNLLK